jgi:2-dehydropantoate 2-reductase
VRFVVFGAGAIGGVLGARLHQGGHDVTLIARGEHHAAIRRDGLTLETPDERVTLPIAAVDDPAAVDWRGDEVVLLATKTQDSAGALGALRAVAPAGVAVVCVQNGIENERLALRLFADVYGAVVMSPTAHMEPGVVQGYGTKLSGVIDLGRYPTGVDERAREIAHAIASSHYDSEARPDIMRFKYAKLILNLTNVITAVCERGVERDELIERVGEEGATVLDAAGIDHAAGDVDDVIGRWERYGVRDIGGSSRRGSSTWQSIARGASAIETDYLNGEIVLIARMHGVPAPLNQALCELGALHARERRSPETLPVHEVIERAKVPQWTS